jgi:hypothetical protein
VAGSESRLLVLLFGLVSSLVSLTRPAAGLLSRFQLLSPDWKSLSFSFSFWFLFVGLFGSPCFFWISLVFDVGDFVRE